MYDRKKVSAVLLCAGLGKRMAAGKNKLLLEISGTSILTYTAKLFDSDALTDEIVFVVSKEDKDVVSDIVKNSVRNKPFCITEGGSERQISSYHGVLASSGDIVMIHDGARPFASSELIRKTVEAAAEYGAAAPGIPITDTLKKTENGFITQTVDRTQMIGIQTPQAFRRDMILKAHEKAEKDGYAATDDCMLAEYVGQKVKVVEGEKKNIKITVREDLAIAADIIKERSERL